jgi:hypothetical protein
MEQRKAVEITVVEWPNGEREVAIFLPELDQMISLSAEGARMMAFRLMECSDYLVPPFAEVNDAAALPALENSQVPDPEESFFGPYEEEPLQIDPEDEGEST